MTRGGGDCDEAWPDQGEWSRWNAALTNVRARLQQERGVNEPWQLTTGWGALWAEYGDLRLRVAGVGAEVTDQDDLFEQIDEWVAFDRAAGPGRVLDRDRQAMAEWRQQIPTLRQLWEEAARRVFRDVEATTDLQLPWKIEVHEDEPDWSAIHQRFVGGGGIGGVVGGILPMDMPMPELPRRPLNFPQIWLEIGGHGRSLPAVNNEADATAHLADVVQEDVIEEVHGAWPPCPRHAHPLEVHYADAGRPMWSCPTTPDITVPIGELTTPLDDSSA